MSIDAEGNPALTGPPTRAAWTNGRWERGTGPWCCWAIPSLAVAVAPVEVAEGLADALALAARADAPAIATLGTGEMVSGNLAHWLADASRVRVYADRDAAKDGRPPAGLRAARALVRAVEAAGGHADAVHAPDPHKDAAAYAAAVGFPPVADGWDEYAKTLAETTDWPRWEIARAGRHSLLCGGLIMTLRGEPAGQDALDLAERLAELLAEHPNDQAGRDAARRVLAQLDAAERDQPLPEFRWSGDYTPPKGSGLSTAGYPQTA